MSDPSLALQKAIRARLVATSAVTALVPAANIVDRHQLPVLNPSIVLGEDQEVDPEFQTLKRKMVRVYSTIHVWKRESSLVGVKQIAGAIRRAIENTRKLNLNDPDFMCSDCRVDGVRFTRDPDGETSHAVITLDSIVSKAWEPA